MLRAIELTNFKCFAQQRIELGAVTLLAGQNGMGKSTVLQSLLLLQQSDALVNWLKSSIDVWGIHGGPRDEDGNYLKVWEDSLDVTRSPPLLLNGRYVTAGTSKDILCERASTDRIEIQLHWTGERFVALTFDTAGNERDAMKLAEMKFNDERLGEPFISGARYLAAERIGPRLSHAVSAYHVEELDAVGSDGAYAVDFLERRGGYPVELALCRSDAVSISLAEQVRAWMAEISPGIRLHTQSVGEVNATSLGVSFASGRAVSRPFRPTGVGFGISYTLPVVITLLAARPGSLVFVENPEAHLHPRGQMALGELLARAGAAGIQVIVETHSDHVVNGVRLAVKDKKIAADQVKFNYFTRRDEGDRLVHEVVSPRIDADGRLDQWPEGFFDQWDLALERLI